MTRLEALRALYAAVKDGHMPTFPVSFAAIGEAAHIAGEALERKSVDAALSLIAATLPEWPFVILTRLCGAFDENTLTLVPDEWRAELSDGWRGYPSEDDPEWHYVSEDHPKPATALLLACIAAHIAKEEAPK